MLLLHTQYYCLEQVHTREIFEIFMHVTRAKEAPPGVDLGAQPGL